MRGTIRQLPAGTRPTRMQVNLIMHLMTPYRAPVVRALLEHFDVEVQVMERPSQFGSMQSKNRSEDWRPSFFSDLPMKTLQTIRFQWHGVALFTLLSSKGARPVRKCDAVILNGWEAPAYWQTLLKAKLLRKGLVNLYESPGNSHRYTRGPIAALRKLVLRSMDAIVSPGEAATRSLIDLGVAPHRIFEGFNAVDVSFFDSATNEYRASSTPPEWSASRVLYVGQFIERKRVDYLLDAFAHLPDHAELVLIGAGGLRSALEARCRQLGIEKRVTFAGQVLNSELPKYFASCSTLCLISVEEVWGLVVNEALAAGLRVIISENCGVASSVDGMQGVRIVRSDLSDLPAALTLITSEATEPLASPEILRHGPQEFAQVFGQALITAVTKSFPAEPVRWCK